MSVADSLPPLTPYNPALFCTNINLIIIILNFRDTFNHIRRIDKSNAPMIVDNFETKGIGYENELEC